MIGTTKRLWLSAGFLLALALQMFAAEQPARTADGLGKVAAGVTAQVVTIDKIEYRVTGPFKHENLAVYLLHAKAEARRDEQFLTLDEGLRKGLVSVHEKKGGGSVQELIIQNRSDFPLYLQEGDRLSGGQQDRTVQTPLVIGPRSGPQALPTFCIEQSRWKASNPENKFAASGSIASAPKGVRQAAKFESNQGEVWSKVKSTKDQYAMSFQSANTNSSLNESLDSTHAKAAAAGYVGPLSRLINGQKDVVGVAFAVEGKIEEVNVYSGQPLLAKMYPRLLESYAMEAAVARGGHGEGGDGKLNERNAKTAEILKKPLNTKYNGMEFEEVLDDLRTAVGVEFIIDWNAIEDAGIKRSKRIVVRVRNTGGDEVLRQVLDFAGGREKDLDYTIVEGAVHISRKASVAELAAAQKKKAESYLTDAPRNVATSQVPDLDAIAAFMSQGLSEAGGKARDRQIDAHNKLQTIELKGRFFARSMVGQTVVHRQWMRAEKTEAVKK